MASMRPVSSLDGLIWRTSTVLTPTAAGGIDGMPDGGGALQAVPTVMKASDTATSAVRLRCTGSGSILHVTCGGVLQLSSSVVMTFSFREGPASMSQSALTLLRGTCHSLNVALGAKDGVD